MNTISLNEVPVSAILGGAAVGSLAAMNTYPSASAVELGVGVGILAGPAAYAGTKALAQYISTSPTAQGVISTLNRIL